jgi:hypothetical protein
MGTSKTGYIWAFIFLTAASINLFTNNMIGLMFVGVAALLVIMWKMYVIEEKLCQT